MHNNIMICIGTEIEKQQLLSDYPHVKNVIRDGGYFVIAKTEDTIVGFLWAFKRKIPAPVEKYEIFINIIEVIYTNLRCRGVASEMLSKITEIATKEQVYQVRAWCDIDNIPSHRLWLKNRFTVNPVKMPDSTISGSFVSLVL